MLSLLCAIADDENGVTSPSRKGDSSHIGGGPDPRAQSSNVDAPQPHPVLSNETTKTIILRYHQQRAHLQRALEVCAKTNLHIPNVLMEALHYIITDTQPNTGGGSYESNGGSVSPARGGDGGSAATLCHDAINLTRKRLDMSISDFVGTSPSPAHGTGATSTSAAHKTDDKSVEQHISLATHALLNHPGHPARIVRDTHASQLEKRELAAGHVSVYSPSKTSTEPKRLLEAAHEARRSGNSRQDIKGLVDYLQRGQEGSILLDTSATTRILRQLADAHIALGEYVSAEQYLFDWYMIAEKVGDRSDAVRALMQLGSCSHKRGDVDAARDWLTQAKLRAPERQSA